MKSSRHEKIFEIINRQPIETQDELLEALSREGCKVTQATISRDIKDLRLVKTLGTDGRYRYTASQDNSVDIRSSFSHLLITSVLSIDRAQNTVVVKTLGGMANALCAALDSMANHAIVGTLAGDDTIFIACRENDDAAQLMEYLKQQKNAR